MNPDKLPFERIARTVLIRRKSESDPKFGCVPAKRPASMLIHYGIVNINKPRGPTSHQVSAYVQQILGIDKAGHSGTLDPHVTGVLPVALGNGTRIVEGLLTAGKEYVCLMHLHADISEEDLRRTAAAFTGKIKQLPPVKSAVKRQMRFRTVYYLTILEINKRDVLFRVGCQAGTYIRKLVHDLGKATGSGAHMAELVRTKAGPFKDTAMWTLQDLRDAMWYWKEQGDETFLRKVIEPIEHAVSHLPKVWVMDTTVDTLCHGAQLNVPGIASVESGIELDQTVAIMTLKQELVCLGIARMESNHMITKEKGLAVKTSKVFMQPGTYPKLTNRPILEK